METKQRTHLIDIGIDARVSGRKPQAAILNAAKKSNIDLAPVQLHQLLISVELCWANIAKRQPAPHNP